MGQARRDRTFNEGISPFSDIRKDVFYDMTESHINEVFDYLEEKFSFPRQWRLIWRKHLNDSPRGENEIALFLVWGNKKVDPILNALLLRGSLHNTFGKLCEYIVTRKQNRDTR